jgi:hypothetical protein
MRLLALFAVLVLVALSARALHAYHATLTELRYNGDKKQLEFSIKVFTDDLEKVLSRGQATPVMLDEKGPRPKALIDAYLQRTLEVKTPGGETLPLKFLGMQLEKDGYWLFCKVPLPRPMSSVSLRQAMLLDEFGDEVNIVNLEAGDKKHSALFRAGHEQELLTW